MPILLSYTTAVLLGSLHALEADHMAAVTSFAVRRPGLRTAVGFGVRWAVGHGAAIVLIGAALIVLGLHLPAAATHWLERLVGAVMIGLGVWTLHSARHLHAHEHVHGHAHVAADAHQPHTHLHAHRRPHANDKADQHGHAVTAVGMIHGLAGSGSAVALIPVVGFESPGAAVFYLVLFAVGTIAGMALWALLAGAFVGRAAHRSVRLARIVAAVTGVFTMVIGGIWLLG